MGKLFLGKDYYWNGCSNRTSNKAAGEKKPEA
jgi:hypothetical protein